MLLYDRPAQNHPYLLDLQIAVLLVLSCTTVNTALAKSREKICIVKTIEYPGKDPVMWDALFAARDGKVYTGLITEAGSAHFYLYDPKKGKNRLIADIAEFVEERGKGTRTSGKIHNKPVEDNDGNIYFVPLNNGGGPRNIDFTSWRGASWLRYNPKKDKLENLGLVAPGDGLYPLTIDKKRMRLFGIGFTGYLYRFDISSKVTKVLGRVSNWDICRDIFSDDKGNVYGCFPTARMWKYDARTEKVNDLSIRLPYDATVFPTELQTPQIDRTNNWRAIQWDPIEKVAYGVTCGSGSILFRYDPHDGPEGKVTALAKMCDTKFLDRKDVPYSTLAFAIDSKNKKAYFAPSARDYDVESNVETFGSGASHHLIMYDIKAKKRIDLGVLRTIDGRRVFGCEGASVGPDGTVYLCGQVEVEPGKGIWYINKTPVAMQLIIYEPK